VSASAITFAIIAAIVVLFVSSSVPVVVVALATPIALYVTGVLTPHQALAGLGDPVVVFIASLFVVAAGLETTGVTAWASQFVMAHAGSSRTRLLVLLSLAVALLTALITPNGAVAALLPVVMVTAVRLKQAPSQLLMPFVFASHAGSLLALTGSPVNVLAAEAAAGAGVKPFGFFEFAVAGIPLLLGTIAINVLLGRRLLPHRGGQSIPADLSRHARTLSEQYRLDDGLLQLRVRPGSPLVGVKHATLDLTKYPELAYVAVLAGGTGGPPARPEIAADDLILVRGSAASAAALAADAHLAFRSADDPTSPDTLFNRVSGLAEVMIPPRSNLIGAKVFPGMTTESGDLVILAVHRRGEDGEPGETVLGVGDTVLLQGTWKALDEHLADPNVLVVDSPEVVRRQAIPMGKGAYTAIAILVLMVVALASGVIPSAMVTLIAATTVVLLGLVSVDQAYRAINWTTVIQIGAMIPLSTAMTETGAARQMADLVVHLVGNAGPHALFAGFFVLTALLGQLISNTATAIIIIPIALVAATDMNISPRSMLMSVAVASAAALLTPVATPVNLIVMGPGGYRFTDYTKFGLPVMFWFFVIAVFYVPLFWRF
jgi:di/tricarboxylate transporter